MDCNSVIHLSSKKMSLFFRECCSNNFCIYAHTRVPFYSLNNRVKCKAAHQGDLAWKTGKEQMESVLLPKGISVWDDHGVKFWSRIWDLKLVECLINHRLLLEGLDKSLQCLSHLRQEQYFFFVCFVFYSRSCFEEKFTSVSISALP